MEMENNSANEWEDIQASLLVYGMLQKHMVLDHEGRYFLDLDFESTVYNDMIDYIAANTENAIRVVCIALQCAAVWLGQLGKSHPDIPDTILAHCVDLMKD